MATARSVELRSPARRVADEVSEIELLVVTGETLAEAFERAQGMEVLR